MELLQTLIEETYKRISKWIEEGRYGFVQQEQRTLEILIGGLDKLTEHDAEIIKWAEENSGHANNICLDNTIAESNGETTDHMVIRISELKQKLSQE